MQPPKLSLCDSDLIPGGFLKGDSVYEVLNKNGRQQEKITFQKEDVGILQFTKAILFFFLEKLLNK